MRASGVGGERSWREVRRRRLRQAWRDERGAWAALAVAMVLALYGYAAQLVL